MCYRTLLEVSLVPLVLETECMKEEIKKKIVELAKEAVDQAYWGGESAGGVEYGSEYYSPGSYLEDLEKYLESL